MALVIKGDLSSVNSSKIVSSLDKIATETENLSKRIQTFISNSKSNLTGGGYDAVRNKMAMYADALNKQGQIYSNLKNNLVAANNTMINFMEEFDSLDDSQVDVAEASLTQAKKNIQHLKVLRAEYASIKSDDKKNNKNYSLSDLNTAISTYIEEVIRLEKLVKKLRELSSTDNSAYAMISAISNDISNYKTAVSGINIMSFDSNGKLIVSNPSNNNVIDSKNTLKTTQKINNNRFYNLGNRDVLYYDQRGYKNGNGEIKEWQSKWRSISGDTIKIAGCGPTTYATVLGTMQHDSTITPETVADVMADNHISNNSNYVGKLSELYGINYQISHFNADTIEKVIQRGGGFIAAVNNGSHYIAVTDVVRKNNTRYFVVCDSWPGFNNNLAEPILMTEEQLRNKDITMDFYMTPKNVPISLDSKGNLIEV